MKEISIRTQFTGKQQEMMLKKQREIEYALAKMEHRIHLIKEATKAKAEQMVIKRSATKNNSYCGCPEYDG